MKASRLVSLLAVAAALGGGALAYDSATPKSPVPAHSCPWIETPQPDVRTVFLWKFSTDKDRESEIGSVLSFQPAYCRGRQ